VHFSRYPTLNKWDTKISFEGSSGIWKTYHPSGIWFLLPFSARISSKYHMGFETLYHFQLDFFHIPHGIWNHIALPISGIRNLQRYTEFALFRIPLQRTDKPILAENGIKSELHVKIQWRGVHASIHPKGPVVFWLTEWNKVNQDTTDPEVYTLVCTLWSYYLNM
jgi:hypothetical protein